MDASKLTNGSRDEVLAKHSAPEAKSRQPNAVRSETKKVGKRATGRKGKTARPQVEAVRKIENGETRLPLLRERRSSPQLHQAARSPMSSMFQQALWLARTD